MNLLNRVRAYRHFDDVELLERALSALIVVGSRKRSLLVDESIRLITESLRNRANNLDEIPPYHEMHKAACEPLPDPPAKPLRSRSRLGRGLSALLGDTTK